MRLSVRMSSVDCPWTGGGHLSSVRSFASEPDGRTDGRASLGEEPDSSEREEACAARFWHDRVLHVRPDDRLPRKCAAFEAREGKLDLVIATGSDESRVGRKCGRRNSLNSNLTQPRGICAENITRVRVQEKRPTTKKCVAEFAHEWRGGAWWKPCETEQRPGFVPQSNGVGLCQAIASRIVHSELRHAQGSRSYQEGKSDGVRERDSLVTACRGDQNGSPRNMYCEEKDADNNKVTECFHTAGELRRPPVSKDKHTVGRFAALSRCNQRALWQSVPVNTNHIQKSPSDKRLRKVPSSRWAEIRTAYAAGIGLREMARKLGIPAGTVLARARRERWTGRIRDAKALGSPASPVVSVAAAAAATMAERGQRHLQRVAGIVERTFPSLEQMEPNALLDRVEDFDRLDKIGRRTFGLDDGAHHAGFTVNIALASMLPPPAA